MLDPSLPWLAAGYRNFKEKEFLRPHSAVDFAHHRYLETGSNHPELRPTTPMQHQHRRIKSATHVRVHNRASTPVKHRLSTRPRSARSTTNGFRNEKVGCYNYSPETLKALSLSRRPKSASAVLLRQHRPSGAQNKSVTQIERLHHKQEVMNKIFSEETGEEVQHSCPYCPVECRPASSSSHKPTSSTGLLAAHLPSHQDRRTNWTRPKTAPTTKRDLSTLPRYNNVRRGRVPYYSHFVSKLPIHARERTPSPPALRGRRAFQEEPAPVALDDDDDAEDEEEELVDDMSEEELNIEEDDVAEPIPAPKSPVPPPVIPEEPNSEPPEEVLQAWSPETVAPTPTPNDSRRNSQVYVEVPSTPIPPESPVPPQLPEKPATPPPPQQKPPTPKPKSPTPPPPKSPTPPPPKSPTPPPPQLTTRPPKGCVHKPKPPIPPLPKVKKEVRIQEPPKEAGKVKVIEKKEKKPIEAVKRVGQKPPEEPPKPAPVKPTLKKTPSKPEIEVAPPIKLEPPPLPSLPPEPEPEPQPEPETVPEKPPPDEVDSGPKPEEPAPVEEKKKLGPPPKVKIDVFSMDPQAMRELLDLQMKARRRGNLSDDEDDAPPASLAHLVEPTTRMLKQSEWLRGRIALSRRAARFELPFDVAELADMTPVEYLRRYCIISQRRKALYKKAFVKVDKDNDGKINRKELEKAVLDALVDTIQPDKVTTVLEYLGEEDNNVFASRFFAAFCALLERLYYKEFTKEDISNKKEEKEKEILEEADFTGLDWKLDGQYVNPPLKNLLYML